MKSTRCFLFRDRLTRSSYDVESFLRLPADPDLCVAVKEPFLAVTYLLFLGRLDS